MTNDTTSTEATPRLPADLLLAIANLRCVHEIMVNSEGISGVPKHARVTLEGVLRGLEEYAGSDGQAIQ